MSTSPPITDLQRMAPSELRKELTAKRAETAKMRMSLAMQSEKNSAAYKVAKKNIATMCMVLGQLETNQKSDSDEKLTSKKAKNTVKVSGSPKKTGKKKSSASSESSDSSASS